MSFLHQFSVIGCCLRRAAFKLAAFLVCPLTVLALLSAVQNTALAQAVNGFFHGTVTASTGAVIPGAQVEIRNLSNGATRDATTDDKGFYTITDLPPHTTP